MADRESVMLQDSDRSPTAQTTSEKSPQNSEKSPTNNEGDQESTVLVHLPANQPPLAMQTLKIDEVALMRKVSWRVIPPLLLMYYLCFLDRVNLSNVAAALKKDLPLTPDQYTSCVQILFLGYILFEMPSNLVLKKVPAATWFSRIMISWGLVSMMQAWVHSYGGLMVCRVFLGVCEAGLFPGLVFYLTQWYTRRERASIFCAILCMQCVSGASGGLIAYGVLRMDGDHARSGWSWLFIIEGAPTIFVGFLIYFLVTSSPDSASWLTAEEKHFIKERVRTPPLQPVTWRDFLSVITNLRLILFTAIFMMILTCVYGLSFFNVPVLSTFTKDELTANALSVPVYAISFIIMVFFAYVGDVHQNYALMTMCSCLLAGAGFIILALALRTHNPFGFKYVGLITATAGSVGASAPLLAWSISTLVGSTQNAAGAALLVMLANLGGVIGPTILNHSFVETGKYADGAWGLMAAAFFAAICTFFLAILYPYEDSLKEAEDIDFRTGYGKTVRNMKVDLKDSLKRLGTLRKMKT